MSLRASFPQLLSLRLPRKVPLVPSTTCKKCLRQKDKYAKLTMSHPFLDGTLDQRRIGPSCKAHALGTANSGAVTSGASASARGRRGERGKRRWGQRIGLYTYTLTRTARFIAEKSRAGQILSNWLERGAAEGQKENETCGRHVMPCLAEDPTPETGERERAVVRRMEKGLTLRLFTVFKMPPKGHLYPDRCDDLVVYATTPFSLSSVISFSPYPSTSLNTSSVCSPSNGGGIRILGSALEYLTG